ncbi:patatin-like phospholipase family protein [Aestuariibius sp. 2305UL40-4]|uniref:patatin-like phospholipase family protein n=1 Tax=Aestuariibius violaceus TaxID=3234132 RepID=UPI00345E70DE
MKRGLAIYGGGNYIFYIAGVLNRLIERGLQFDASASYSAGAALIPAVISKNIDVLLNFYCAQSFDRLGAYNNQNMAWFDRIFSRDAAYFRILRNSYDFGSIQSSQKDIRVIFATYESRILGGRIVALGGLAALAAYARSRRLAGQTALTLFKRCAGLRADIVDMRTCTTRDEAIHIVQGSSTIYPFIKIRSHKGRYMLDGKFALLSPIAALDDCDRIISVHGSYTFPVKRKNLVQIGPNRPLNAKPFELIDREGVFGLFERGTADADSHYESIAKLGFFDDRSKG